MKQVDSVSWQIRDDADNGPMIEIHLLDEEKRVQAWACYTLGAMEKILDQVQDLILLARKQEK